MVGYTMDELSKMTVLDILSEDSIKVFKENRDDVISKKNINEDIDLNFYLKKIISKFNETYAKEFIVKLHSINLDLIMDKIKVNTLGILGSESKLVPLTELNYSEIKKYFSEIPDLTKNHLVYNLTIPYHPA